MLNWLGRVTVRARVVVLLAAIAVVVLAGLAAGSVTDRLAGGGFDDAGPEVAAAERTLEDTFQAGEPNLVLLADAGASGADSAPAAKAGKALTERLATEPDVTEVTSYWVTGLPSLKSTDGSKALVVARITGDEKQIEERAGELSKRYTGDEGPLRVSVGGSAEVIRQISVQSEDDLVRAEAIALPITLVLLIIVFGGLVAGLLPVIVGILTVLGALLILYGLADLTDVSVFALNLTTALGLGLAIDYSLFIVSRFREELAGGHDVQAAVIRSVVTAGRTVMVSALAVAGSLAVLLVFPQMFLRSIAYAGIAVVACATITAVVILPALLAVLGHKVNSLTVRRRAAQGAAGGASWHRVALAVMRRPLLVAVSAVTILLLLGVPFLDVRFGDVDDRALPTTASARQVSDQLRNDFDTRDTDAIAAVATDIGDPDTRAEEIDDYASVLSGLVGVARVDAVTGTYEDGRQVTPASPFSLRFASTDATWLQIVPDVEAVSPEGEALVKRIRATVAPFKVKLAGPSVELTDGKKLIADRLPLAGALIAVVSFLVLMIVFGSLLLPLIGLLLNVLSLTAAFGAMVWGFQDGNLDELLDFTATGTIEISIPVLLFFLAFGLSMDYQVFMLSRIKEEYDNGADNTTAVAVGLQRTGPIITAAAALIAVVFVGLAAGEISIIKLLGVGLALAVIVDATIVRAALVPAFMRLAGRANWWAPRPILALHRRLGIHHTLSPPEQTPSSTPPAPAFTGPERDLVVRTPDVGLSALPRTDLPVPAPHVPESRQVEFARNGDRPVAALAKDLGVSESSLRKWIVQAEMNTNGSDTQLTSAEKRELAELRSRNRELELENEILKKAAAYFARENILPK
ncbi:MAG TPA: MMPL family transporter [Micromonosporaceae bacterium]|nr:MMPL family transporter [Micromonosporaceae bacterium]